MENQLRTNGESPFIPHYFLRELRLYDAALYPLWIKKTQRWSIVRAVPRHVSERGYVEEFAVQKGDEYQPLDRRVLNEIKAILYARNRLGLDERHLVEIQADHVKVSEEGDRHWRDAKRESDKTAHRLSTTKTFI